MRGLFLYLFLSPILGFAQAHVRLIDEPTRMWTSSYGGTVDAYCSDTWETTFWLAGDTLISDTMYQKVASRTYYYQGYINAPMNACTTSFYFDDVSRFVREVDHMVYARLSNSSERLIYDFNAEIGDTIPFPWNLDNSYTYGVVDEIDSVEVNGTYRKRFRIPEDPQLGGDDPFIVEGIGGCNGPFQGLHGQIGLSHFVALICVAEQDEVIYGDPNCSFITSIAVQRARHELLITPNPSNGHFRLSGLAPSERYMVLDAAGRVLVTGSSTELDMRPYPDGLYLLRVAGTERNVVDAQRLLIQR